jgi:hypothetical protein
MDPGFRWDDLVELSSIDKRKNPPDLGRAGFLHVLLPAALAPRATTVA